MLIVECKRNKCNNIILTADAFKKDWTAPNLSLMPATTDVNHMAITDRSTTVTPNDECS